MTTPDVEQAISDGENGACLIEWCYPWKLLEEDPQPDPMESIEQSKREFLARGWTWNATERRLEKDGWYAWYRSQGQCGPPIIQWGRIKTSTPE